VFDSYGGGGSEATLYELNCFMSNSGARRQLVHADNACVEQQVGLKPEEPIMLTCFVSLQDVDETMGPTSWIPGTHNVEAHREFYEIDSDASAAPDTSSKDILLQTRSSVVGTLPKGACAIFDPRVLHCAGANTCSNPDMTRALFYFSFKNPRVDYPGCPSCSGYGIFNAELTMQEFCDDLSASAEGKPAGQRLESVVCFP
jgi:ectoine hydroxylase-related dioxygenase (phytanoyl-CoA dioxygenase family)